MVGLHHDEVPGLVDRTHRSLELDPVTEPSGETVGNLLGAAIEAPRQRTLFQAFNATRSRNVEQEMEEGEVAGLDRKIAAGHDPQKLQRYCTDKCGVVLGTGIGDLQGKAFRIAHMGHVNAAMILGTLGVVEVGLNALNMPHGKGGMEAAVSYLGETVAA